MNDSMSRKSFLRLTMGACALGVAGCDDGDDDGIDTESMGTDDADETSSGTSSDSSSSGSGSSSDDSSSSGSGPSSSGSSGEDSESDGSTGMDSDSMDTTAGDDPSDDANAGGNACMGMMIVADIETTHPHEATIDGATLEAGMFTMSGSHTHTFELSEDDVARLQNGESVSMNSSEDNGHTHNVTLSCA